MAITTTGPLATSGATGTLALSGAAVIAGSGSLPIYAGLTPNAAAAGIYIVASADFVGGWVLSRHPAGMQSQNAADPGAGRMQVVVQGDNNAINAAGAGPIGRLTATDSVTLTVLAYTSGSLTMSVVQ